PLLTPSPYTTLFRSIDVTVAESVSESDQCRIRTTNSRGEVAEQLGVRVGQSLNVLCRIRVDDCVSCCFRSRARPAERNRVAPNLPSCEAPIDRPMQFCVPCHAVDQSGLTPDSRRRIMKVQVDSGCAELGVESAFEAVYQV